MIMSPFFVTAPLNLRPSEVFDLPHGMRRVFWRTC